MQNKHKIENFIRIGVFVKAAIIGSRKIGYSDFEKYLPQTITEIIWSGKNEVLCEYAKKKGIKLTLLLPDINYGRAAGFMRDLDAMHAADIVIAFCDDNDVVVKTLVDYCKRINKNIELITV